MPVGTSQGTRLFDGISPMYRSTSCPRIDERSLARRLLRAFAESGHERTTSTVVNESTTKNVLARIRRVAGRLDGVSRMIEGIRRLHDAG